MPGYIHSELFVVHCLKVKYPNERLERNYGNVASRCSLSLTRTCLRGSRGGRQGVLTPPPLKITKTYFLRRCRNESIYTVISEFFARFFFIANSVERHICDAKKSRPVHDLPISVNDRVISTFRQGFIFAKLRICEVLRK